MDQQKCNFAPPSVSSAAAHTPARTTLQRSTKFGNLSHGCASRTSVGILAEGAIALSVTLSGGELFT